MAGSYAYADNTITVTEGTEEVPANMADMQVANDGGGWGVMTNPFANIYIIDAHVDFGDGATATYFTSKDGEMVYGKDGKYFSTKANAVLQLGELIDSHSINGVCWNVVGKSDWNYRFVSDGASCKIYGSKLLFRSVPTLITLYNPTIRQSILEGSGTVDGSLYLAGTINISNKVYFVHWARAPHLTASPELYEDVHSHHVGNGIWCSRGTIVCRGAKVTDYVYNDVVAEYSDSHLELIDPLFNIQSPNNMHEDAWIKERYTVNIHIAKADGTNLSGVNVKCYDKDGAEVFSVNTDANGDIAEQTVTYKKWEGTEETLTEYTPHKFVITKTDYTPLILENVAVDKPIVWHLELQSLQMSGYTVLDRVVEQVVVR